MHAVSLAPSPPLPSHHTPSPTPKVASRVQKYFLKLAKAGMPVPGIVPKISHSVKPRKVGRILSPPIGQAVNTFVWGVQAVLKCFLVLHWLSIHPWVASVLLISRCRGSHMKGAMMSVKLCDVREIHSIYGQS